MPASPGARLLQPARPTASIAPNEGSLSPSAARFGVDGGSLAELRFAALGDTRPPDENDTPAYPTPVIMRLFGAVENLEPRPAFVVATGDYLFASRRSEAAAQLELYVRARALYSGPFFPAMGNHECTGATVSNCAIHESAAYEEFVRQLLAPIDQALPYYVVRFASGDGAWTAKFLFIAANAWSSAQQAWLEAGLAEPTTYTFAVRHEPAYETRAPGVAPSEAILARHPYTLVLAGHEHTYGRTADRPREVVIGNGGAPLSSRDYGFALFARRPDGAIVVDMINWQTGRADPAFHFAVAADGSAVP